MTSEWSKERAREIVDRFFWTSNVMRNGRLVGQQYIVAEAVAEALDAARALGREWRTIDDEAKKPRGFVLVAKAGQPNAEKVQWDAGTQSFWLFINGRVHYLTGTEAPTHYMPLPAPPASPEGKVGT